MTEGLAIERAQYAAVSHISEQFSLMPVSKDSATAACGIHGKKIVNSPEERSPGAST